MHKNINSKFSKFLNEGKKMKDDPCWDSHEMVGHKTKNGKKVPNCVPKEETELEEVQIDEFIKIPPKGKESEEHNDEVTKKRMELSQSRRKKKESMSEEELQELSKNQMAEYIRAASRNKTQHATDAKASARRSNELYVKGAPMKQVDKEMDNAMASTKKAYNRQQGIDIATKKLTKEDTMNEDTDWRKLANDEANAKMAAVNKNRKDMSSHFIKHAEKALAKHGFKELGSMGEGPHKTSLHAKYCSDTGAGKFVKLHHGSPSAQFTSTYGVSDSFYPEIHHDDEAHKKHKENAPVEFEAHLIKHAKPGIRLREDTEEFHLGDNVVEHNKYGFGNILSESDESIEVAFKTGIIKLDK